MDNVLADFNAGFEKVYSQLYGNKIRISLEHYDVLHDSGLPQKEKQKIYDTVFCTPGFWIQFNPIPNSIEVMEELNQKFDLFICSKPTNKGDMNCTREKLLWLDSHFPFLCPTKQVIFMSEKHLLDGNNRILIDDSVDHLEKWSKGVAIKFFQPYNQDFMDADFDVADWLEIGSLLLDNYEFSTVKEATN